MIRAAIALLTVLTASSQGDAGERDDAAQAAYAAFQCAELGRLVVDPVVEVERDRLLTYGLAEGRLAGPEAMYPGGVPVEPLGGISDDFWIGYVLAQASDDVEADLSTQIGDNSITHFDQRQQLAAQEFRDRNCRLIGK